MTEPAPRILAVIPARGGSKGLPGKNIRPLAGKPLIGWTIEAARASRWITRTVVSSEDPEILAVARDYGAETPFIRPAQLAQDDTPGLAVVLHALDALPDFDWVVLLQPTSPLRKTEDIDGAIARCLSAAAPACVSVSEAPCIPGWLFQITPDHHLQGFLPETDRPKRRQDAPMLHTLNGAVYVARTAWLRQSGGFLTDETLAWPMPVARSVDIDTLLDFRLAEVLLAARLADDGLG
ncbi:cytidylyltransferase domain-containing protein [Halothiobacillus sp. DCM-1]|uniref:acylneuraminate cytidylyltransferase family protein n=1 Tax=Halothiobacillus sp. DCM-1 TaxID=3112558 RepID=UPI003245E570